MSKFQDLLSLRFRSKEQSGPQKITELVERATSGSLSGFSGVFRVTELNDKEKGEIEEILRSYKNEDTNDIASDLESLISITSEVKAINNQAAILHGERIERAQAILTHYREGAFTSWLISTYGNRQTPYNFLQYYQFYNEVSPDLQTKLDEMPRQAVYTLASRDGGLEKKEELIRNYSGETKSELLDVIREEFPLKGKDRRHAELSSHALDYIKRAFSLLSHPQIAPTQDERDEMTKLLSKIAELLNR
jgi:hypothetical protein